MNSRSISAGNVQIGFINTQIDRSTLVTEADLIEFDKYI